MKHDNTADRKPKAIRFFLNDLNGGHIHNLQELRQSNTIAIEHLYELFVQGILERWLEVQGEAEVLAELKKLEKKKLDEAQARKFAAILFPGESLADMELLAQGWKLLKQWQEERNAFAAKDKDRNVLVKSYHDGFAELLAAFRKDAANMPALKMHVARLKQDYLQLFMLNALEFVTCLCAVSPASLLCMLADQKMRAALKACDVYYYAKNFIGNNLCVKPQNRKQHVLDFLDKETNGDVYLSKDDNYAQSLQKIYGDMSEDEAAKILVLSDFLPGVEKMYGNMSAGDAAKQGLLFGDRAGDVVSLLHMTSKNTDNSWEDEQPHQDRQFMILRGQDKNVRPYRMKDGELTAEQLEDYPIIDGIDFRNASPSNYLIYMEV